MTKSQRQPELVLVEVNVSQFISGVLKSPNRIIFAKETKVLRYKYQNLTSRTVGSGLVP